MSKKKMFKTPVEAAKEWGLDVRTVQRYCRMLMIPGAEKINNKWQIPIDATCLPAGLGKLVANLEVISLTKEGAIPKLSEQDIKVLHYLSDNGYTSGICFEGDLVSNLRETTITDRGQKLIEKWEQENEKDNKKTSGRNTSTEISIGAKAKGNIGILGVEGEVGLRRTVEKTD